MTVSLCTCNFLKQYAALLVSFYHFSTFCVLLLFLTPLQFPALATMPKTCDARTPTFKYVTILHCVKTCVKSYCQIAWDKVTEIKHKEKTHDVNKPSTMRGQPPCWSWGWVGGWDLVSGTFLCVIRCDRQPLHLLASETDFNIHSVIQAGCATVAQVHVASAIFAQIHLTFLHQYIDPVYMALFKWLFMIP